MTAKTQPIRVFISYTHDSEPHKALVTALAEDLRENGIDASFDRDVHGTPSEGWPRWMEKQVAEASYVLVICTETYLRRYEQRENPGKGLGATWEGSIIRQDLYESAGKNDKFTPVVFHENDIAYKPQPIRGYSHYVYPQHRIGILRWLTNQPAYIPKPLGKVPNLPPDP